MTLHPQATDMLEADANLRTQLTRRTVERDITISMGVEGDAQQVAVPATGVPLSDEQIESLREKTFSTGSPYCPVDNKSMRKAARAIEAHHGIGDLNAS